MKGKPKGLRKIFWALWGFTFTWRLKAKFKELERKGHYTGKTVENVTTKMLNEEAQKLYDSNAIDDNLVYWQGAWIACVVKKGKRGKVY